MKISSGQEEIDIGVAAAGLKPLRLSIGREKSCLNI